MKIWVGLILVLFSVSILAEEAKDSFVEFPFVVIVGQVTKVTVGGVTITNTRAQTPLDGEKLPNLINSLSMRGDAGSLAMSRSLGMVTVTKDQKMQVNLFVDNVWNIFNEDLQIYNNFIPLALIFKERAIKFFQKNKKYQNEKTFDRFVSSSMVKKMLDQNWIAAVFKVDLESGKLVFHSSRIFKSYEKMLEDPFSKEFMIKPMVEAGYALTMSKFSVRGHESQRYESSSKGKDGSNLNSNGRGPDDSIPAGGGIKEGTKKQKKGKK